MRPTDRERRHTEVYQRRLAEAKELGLWPEVRLPEEAERRRRELQGLGFHDWDGDAWDRMVATLRDQRAALQSD